MKWTKNDLATETELSHFLRKVKRRTFKQDVFAVHDDHTALDIAQDAMFKLVDRYPDRPATELARSTDNGVGSSSDTARDG